MSVVSKQFRLHLNASGTLTPINIPITLLLRCPNWEFMKMTEKTEDIYQLAELLPQPEIDLDSIQWAMRQILEAIGEDPDREGLVRTPERVAQMYTELLAGYRTDPVGLINDALFEITYDEMVLVRDIEFYSLCEHHLLPFLGRAHVAYIPKGRVIGLSKIPRIVDLFARRLQLQERMTRQIADFISQLLNPRGVAVVLEGMHMCAMMRGVKKHEARMTTSAMLGIFRSNMATRQEFLDNISRGADPLSF
jgi:GTP cyclohydrolase I